MQKRESQATIRLGGQVSALNNHWLKKLEDSQSSMSLGGSINLPRKQETDRQLARKCWFDKR